MPGDDIAVLASMGNYVFDTQTLIDVVTPREATYTDLGGHVIPALTALGVAHVYDFSKNIMPGQDDHERGYWRDVGKPRLVLRGQHGPDRRRCRRSTSTTTSGRCTHATARSRRRRSHTALAGSRPTSTAACCARVRSCPGPRRAFDHSSGCYVSNDAHVSESILFPGVRVGAGARLHRCIIDKNVDVPPGYRIGHDPDADRTVRRQRERHHRDREGPQALRGLTGRLPGALSQPMTRRDRRLLALKGAVRCVAQSRALHDPVGRCPAGAPEPGYGADCFEPAGDIPPAEAAAGWYVSHRREAPVTVSRTYGPSSRTSSVVKK